MNNEPVGHVVQWVDGSLIHAWCKEAPPVGTPLYTHPANTCKHGVDDGACKECYQEATHPAKTLTDEEIKEVYSRTLQTHFVGSLWVDFARAILRKAQEK